MDIVWFCCEVIVWDFSEEWKVDLISVRLLFCVGGRFGENFIMGKNMSEFEKATVACLNGAFNCLQEVCLGS